MIHQVGSKNEWLLVSENGCLFPPFERSACFYVTISESFKRFQYFDFEINFLENENLSVETTEIENTLFSFKTALSETNEDK